MGRYSLSKLVEVAAHNMARVRLVWASIWRVMADHFTRVGCGKDKAMAHFAVNALKQLAYQFLELSEGISGSFQVHYEPLFGLEHSRTGIDVFEQCSRAESAQAGIWMESGLFVPV